MLSPFMPRAAVQDLLSGGFLSADNDIGQAAKWQQFKVSLSDAVQEAVYSTRTPQRVVHHDGAALMTPSYPQGLSMSNA